MVTASPASYIKDLRNINYLESDCTPGRVGNDLMLSKRRPG